MKLFQQLYLNIFPKKDFEINDLKNFYQQFGEIEDFELNGKISVVLFKSFFFLKQL